MKKKHTFLFQSNNYKILGISIVVLCIGFLIMIGGGGETDWDFNPDIFSFQRIVLSPILIVLGYIGMLYSIFYNDRGN